MNCILLQTGTSNHKIDYLTIIQHKVHYAHLPVAQFRCPRYGKLHWSV